MPSDRVLAFLAAGTDLLDPRPESLARANPIRRSVNIPSDHLRERLHELPSPERTLYVAEVEGHQAAMEFVTQGGRRPRLTSDFEYGSTGGPPARLWEPNPLVTEALRELEHGRALDLGCGAGRDAVALAFCGWDVTAIDHLPDAVARAQDLAKRYDTTLRLLQADARSIPPDPPYDLILSLRFFEPGVVRRTAEWLAPGGKLLLETFTREHGRGAGASRTELETLIAPLRITRYEEGIRGRAVTARTVAARDA